MSRTFPSTSRKSRELPRTSVDFRSASVVIVDGALDAASITYASASSTHAASANLESKARVRGSRAHNRRTRPVRTSSPPTQAKLARGARMRRIPGPTVARAPCSFSHDKRPCMVHLVLLVGHLDDQIITATTYDSSLGYAAVVPGAREARLTCFEYETPRLR